MIDPVTRVQPHSFLEIQTTVQTHTILEKTHPRHVRDQDSPARFDAAMILLDRGALLHLDVAKVKRLGGAEELDDRLGQILLVVLDRQDIVCPLSEDFLSDLGLAAQGVQGDDAPLEHQRIQQRLGRSQLIAFACRAFLSQRYAQRAGVGADHVQGRVRPVLRSSHRLAVEGHNALGRANDAANPLPKAFLEHRCVQNAKYLAKRVM